MTGNYGDSNQISPWGLLGVTGVTVTGYGDRCNNPFTHPPERLGCVDGPSRAHRSSQYSPPRHPARQPARADFLRGWRLCALSRPSGRRGGKNSGDTIPGTPIPGTQYELANPFQCRISPASIGLHGSMMQAVSHCWFNRPASVAEPRFTAFRAFAACI